MDVHLSKDGVPVIMHDPKLNRTTSHCGLIKNYILNELKKVRVGSSEHIPTLKKALEFAKGKIRLGVELTQTGNFFPKVEERVLSTITELDMIDQVYINSFDHYSITKMRRLSDTIALGPFQPGASPAMFPFIKEIAANCLATKIDFLTNHYVHMCEDKGIELITWPVYTEAILSMHAVLSCTTVQNFGV